MLVIIYLSSKKEKKEWTKMSNNTQLPNWIFNVNLESQGIARKLADGLRARIFVGENSMLSIVHIEPKVID